jgi:hypothetical protein
VKTPKSTGSLPAIADGLLFRKRGYTHYELTNHLGNVLATVSDRKLGFQNGETFYRSDVLSVQDYYAFGMEMPDRTFNPNAYKYSINGQEKDTDIDANHTTALYWEYDSRIGRRWNIDPVVKCWRSPYDVFDNSPIWKLDTNGDDDFFNSKGEFVKSEGKGHNIKVITEKGALLLSKFIMSKEVSQNIRLQTAKGIANHYAKSSGVKGEVNIRLPYDALAVTATGVKGRPVYIPIPLDEKTAEYYNNIDDTKSILNHEHYHQEEPLLAGKDSHPFLSHAVVFSNQFKDNLIRNTTDNFRIGEARNMVQLLMNEYVQGSSNNKKGIDDFISDFNKNNKAGITLVAGNSIRTDGTDITIDIIYKGKKQVTETYKKLDDAH